AAAARTAIDRVDAERRHGSCWRPSSLQPFVIITAAAAAAFAVSKKNLVKPNSPSRVRLAGGGGSGAALAVVLGGALACADPLRFVGFRGTKVDGGGRAGLELDVLWWGEEEGQRRHGSASLFVG
ncbi:unnamed protein product, partial [Ectocarpus sp. 8 AP-2014]